MEIREDLKDIYKELLLIKDKPKKLLERLNSIRLNEPNHLNKDHSALMVKMNREDKVDFCQIATDAMEDNFWCFDVIHLFESVLHNLDLDVQPLLEFVETLFEKTKNDLFSHKQFFLFERFVDDNYDFASQFFAELLKQNKPYIFGYISFFLMKFSKRNATQTLDKISQLIDHDSKYVLLGIASALGRFNYNSTENRKLIPEAIRLLDELEKKDLVELNCLIVIVFGQLIDFSEEAKDKITFFSSIDQVLIKETISQVLFRNMEKHLNEEWFSKVLLNQSNISFKNKKIIDNLDFVLAELIKKSNTSLFETFFFGWILKSDFNFGKVRLARLYDSTFVVLIKKKEFLSRILTKLLNHDNNRMHFVAVEITSYCKSQKIKNLKLDKETLKTLTYGDCLFVCRKILGYVIHPEYLCSLSFSVLDAFPRNKEVQDLVEGIFNSFLAQNYPGTTINFLKELKSTSRMKKALIGKVIEEIEQHRIQRNSLNRLKELSPPRKKVHLIDRKYNKKFSTEMEDNQNEAILSLFPQTPIKYGTGFFCYVNGQYSEIIRFQSISSNFEIPNSTVTHLVDAEMERFRFRLAKRGEQ